MHPCTKTQLTPAQRTFLVSYLPDILHGENADLARADHAEFVQRVVGMDFDDGEAAPAAAQRIARNLQKSGLLSALDIHPDKAGGQHIYLRFSPTGANALFELVDRRA